MPGSPSQVWRRIAKPVYLGAEIRWALGPRGFKSHSRRHCVREVPLRGRTSDQLTLLLVDAKN